MKKALTDSFGREIEYLRLSVTDRCDLRCNYCIPKGFRDFEVPEHWLDFNEIVRLVQAFASLGLKKIRLTGGEPLVRKNLSKLAGRISAISGIEDLSLSTNGTQLGKYVYDLNQAGVQRLNISLDTLDRQDYEYITGLDVLYKVLDGIEMAKNLGFKPIKINMVVMAGINDHQIDPMLSYCIERDFTLRLIETMPMGCSGQNARYLNLQPIRRRLKDKFDLVDSVMTGGGPARYLASRDGKIRVGFITPISQHFCATCNRVRLAVDGTLYLCLGQDDRYEFRELLRSGISDSDLREAISIAISRKPERHEFKDSPTKIVRLMSMTGG
jgi:cyclic pyranopterin phosphate synthase